MKDNPCTFKPDKPLVVKLDKRPSIVVKGDNAWMAVERWRITIPFEGLDFIMKRPIDLVDAKIEALEDSEHKEANMISVIVEGSHDDARAKGTVAIDRIAARFSYAAGMEIRTQTRSILH